MTYVHTKERDTFYELSQSGQLSLPASIRSQLNPRHNKAKVRITTDQDSRVLAKIIKVRVADIDIYSPRTAFDWRVSVNLEMNFDGDMKDLVEVQEGHKRPDRNKDRVSYKHLAYQIDLTQVTTPIEVCSIIIISSQASHSPRPDLSLCMCVCVYACVRVCVCACACLCVFPLFAKHT